MRADTTGREYQLGEMNTPWDGDNRLPRSKAQMDAKRKAGSQVRNDTIWVIRNDVFRLYQKLSEDEWGDLLLKWKKFGVMGWMNSFISLYFPGHEEQAKAIGLFADDIVDEVDIIGDGAQDKDASEEEIDC
eukprot:UN10930